MTIKNAGTESVPAFLFMIATTSKNLHNPELSNTQGFFQH